MYLYEIQLFNNFFIFQVLIFTHTFTIFLLYFIFKITLMFDFRVLYLNKRY
jgi:hypothetical protein